MSGYNKSIGNNYDRSGKSNASMDLSPAASPSKEEEERRKPAYVSPSHGREERRSRRDDARHAGEQKGEKQLALQEGVPKFEPFDVAKGKTLRTGCLVMMVLWFFGVPALLMSVVGFVVARDGEVLDWILALCFFCISSWLISITLQNVHIGPEGIRIFNVRFLLFLRRRKISWAEIKTVTPKGAMDWKSKTMNVRYFELGMIDGSTVSLKVDMLNAKPMMIYNLIAAYHNAYYSMSFDWSCVIKSNGINK